MKITVKINEICDLKYGKMPKKDDVVEKGYPIFSGYRIVGYHKEFLYKEPEVVVVARGVGGTGDVKMSPPNAFVTNLSIVLSLKDPSKVLKQFLCYKLQTENLRFLDSGSAQSQITIADLGNHRITIPNMQNQTKIASVLSTYDDLIGNNTRRIQILEEMAQRIYREWFVNFRFSGHENLKFVDSEMGKIPEGWEMHQIGELCRLIKDKFRNIEHSGLPLIDLAKMPQRTIAVGEMGNPDELSTSRIIFEENDILFGSIRPYLHKVVIGPCRGVTNVSVLVLRATMREYLSMLVVILSSANTIRWADQHSTGTKMPVIKWDIFKTMRVITPTRQINLKFSEVIEPMLAKIKVEVVRNRFLRQTRGLLLPKLISGGLDVSDLDIAIKGQENGA